MDEKAVEDMNVNRCKFVFRPSQEPDGYVIYSDPQFDYVLCPVCVGDPRGREFPVYADELSVAVRCDLCDRQIK